MGERSLEALDVAWARRAPARVVRGAVLLGLLGPAMDFYTRRTVVGLEHFEGLTAPVVFVANHASHMDTPVILRALPHAWRRRTVVAAAADYFYVKRRVACAVSVFFSTVPMARDGRGLDSTTTAHLDRVMREGWSLVMFAEGTRSRDGNVGRLHSGAAVLAALHDLPLVPIHVSGTHEVMPVGNYWMQRLPGQPRPERQPIEIHFGAPIPPAGVEQRAEVMERVRAFFEQAGAGTTRPAERPQLAGTISP
ncbi:MAG: lysophospholipid acyltransferase family protein [Solirubrobacteraceae bacterium]